MSGALEQNIQQLNNYLGQENTVLAKNINLEKDINNIEGELVRSTMSYDRYSKLLFYLSIITLILFIYNVEIDVMYPFRTIVSFLTGMAGRQLGLVVLMATFVFFILYFSKSSYSKLVTSLTMTGLLYYLLSRIGIDTMGLPLLIIFFFMFYIFEF
jgi:hypothetical protein